MEEYYDPLADNYDFSRRRLRGLVRRLKQEPTVLHEYDAIIHDQLNLGIVEAVQDVDDNLTVIHYLPHQCSIS